MSFTPFDDSLTIIRPAEPTTNGNTFPYDHLRQGVEIANAKHFYLGTQPKLWAGYNNYTDVNIISFKVDHSVRLVTYGQALSFTDYDGHARFEDLPEFDPVSYIVLGNNYPFPIVFNEGPMQQEEASMEPFTIPFLKKSNEGPIYAHSVNAELEDGNSFLELRKASNRIQQFVELKDPITPAPFLDGGQDDFGGIPIEGFVSDEQRLVRPFDDTAFEFVVNDINTTDGEFLDRLFSLDINDDEDLRPFRHKSAAAGFMYSNVTETGTDSIAFGGLLRGY